MKNDISGPLSDRSGPIQQMAGILTVFGGLVLKYLSTLVFVLACTPCFSAQARPLGQDVIIGFHSRPGAPEKALLRAHGGKIKHTFRTISAYTVRLSSQSVQKLRKDPRIKYIAEDTVYTLIDPVAVDELPAEYANSWGVEHIGSRTAHMNNIFGNGARVAVLDTGIDYTHPELTGKYYGGWDFVFNDNDPYDDSWNSHGTHVAGIIAAAADGSGVIGVAPGAELYGVKVLDGSGFGLLSWIIEGIEWAVDSGMDIVNISIGGPHSDALEEACNAAYSAGVLLIAAAGNNSAVSYPAAYDSVIAVTGTDIQDQLGWFAPSGPDVELAAPGVLIQSTAAGNDYAELSGTSQAAPHVTGLAALIYSVGTYDLNNDGTVDNLDVRLQMQASAIDLGEPGRDDMFGAGLIDVAAALDLNEDPFPELTFELIPGTQHRKDVQKINLAGLPYEVTIANDSLRGVRVLVFANDEKRKDLNRTIHFNKRSPRVVSFWLDASVHNLQVVFIPIGKPGTSATVTIDD